MGTQIALADYATIAGDTPTESELTWLPGVGLVEASSSNICETIYIDKTAGIDSWEVTYDSNGIFQSAFHVSNGEIHTYGINSSG